MFLTLPFLDAPEISIERIYALYCGLKYGLTVKDWIEEQQLSVLHIDERFNIYTFIIFFFRLSHSLL